MPAEPQLVNAPEVLWRVEHYKSDLNFSRINPIDAALHNAGHRFDVLGAGVLYAATFPDGAFAESLADFRPGASLAERIRAAGGDPATEAVGVVPPEWRIERRLRAIEPSGGLPFVDIDDPLTHTHLSISAATVLIEHNLQSLDVGSVRGPDRLLTRALAGWLYQQVDAVGLPRYAGIRYGSRLGGYECWAIFDGTVIRAISNDRISKDDPYLRQVGETFRMTIL